MQTSSCAQIFGEDDSEGGLIPVVMAPAIYTYILLGGAGT